MIKFNVKYTTNTNLMSETLTTKCVRYDTAISRFCRFLNDYDPLFKESLLIASMRVNPIGYVDGVLAYQAVTETDDYYMILSGCNGIWSVTIEFNHDENTEHYRSISHPFSTDSKETDSKETDSKETDSKETDSKETDSKETDNKGYMRCEYFFSLNPKSPPKCKHCIYSDRDFCPADGEKYWGICEE